MSTRQLLGFLALGLLFAASLLTAGAAEPKWDVGICDGYLKGLGAADVWSAADAIGISQIEVNLNPKMNCLNLFEGDGTPYSVGTPEDRQALKAKLAEKKKAVCAFCCSYNYGRIPSDETGIHWLTQAAEAARDLGIPVIMLPLPGGSEMSDAQYIVRSRSLLAALAPVAEKNNVTFAVENLQRFNNRPEVLEPILKSVPADRVGLALDATNMYWYGHPLDKIYALAEQFAPHVRYVHAKNEKYPEDKRNVQREPGWEYGKYASSIREGDIDFRLILQTLAKAGYRGTVTIEDDSLGHYSDAEGKKKVLVDDVKFLREVFATLK